VARRLSPGIEHALFRAAQEGLTNVRKQRALGGGVALDFRPWPVKLAVDRQRPGDSGAAGGFACLDFRERIEVFCGRVESGIATAAAYAHRRGASVKKLVLMLVDDQSLFREALRTCWRLQADFEIAAERKRRAAVARPDAPARVILMDLRMAGRWD